MRTITLDKINMNQFKEGFKKAFNELKDRQDRGENNYKVEIIFDENGKFSGHCWQANCFYSEEDLKDNGDYRLEFEGNEAFQYGELLRKWQDEVIEERAK